MKFCYGRGIRVANVQSHEFQHHQSLKGKEARQKVERSPWVWLAVTFTSNFQLRRVAIE